ncbi:MAG: hypothetical protein DRQ44_18525 [Gammaproteobacteria bacterium]|nr:MAG: hypothetical protein DRQ44_18525 [Gammaproteobacteria bacterium]
MKKVLKLNVLLALTDNLRVAYKNMVTDYSKYFSKSQGAFRGEKRTYTPREGTVDDLSKRGFTPVATTVKEKLDYFIENVGGFVDALFSQEKTNASGIAKAELVVDGKIWGDFTSLELLRLKSVMESSDLGNIEGVLSSIPIRSDSEVWNKCDEGDRELLETDILNGVAKTTIKTPYIPTDPNLVGKDLPVNYQPPIVSRDEVFELGDYTHQKFSGEWSSREKALSLKRRGVLITAITMALKEANDVTAVESTLTADRIFGYLFFGNNK